MIKKLEKILDPKKYREEKAGKFLTGVNNLDFKKFEGKNTEDVIKYICGNGENSGAKEVAEKLYDVLHDELKKDQNIEKAKKNKNASYKYLLDIQNACGTFKYINENSSLEDIITVCDQLRKKFLSARSCSNKFSFLSAQGVKKYMGKQHEALRDSVTNMKRLKNKN